MIKTLLIIILSVNLANAQKIAFNEIDPITGDTIIKSSWVRGLSQKLTIGTSVRIAQVNNIHLLHLHVYSEYNFYSISEGNKLIFKLDNDSIIELKCLDYVNGAKLTAQYYLSPFDLKRLKQAKLSMYRIYLNQGFVDLKVSDNKRNQFSKLINLFDE